MDSCLRERPYFIMVIASDLHRFFSEKIKGHDHVTVGTGFLKTSLLGILASILSFPFVLRS